LISETAVADLVANLERIDWPGSVAALDDALTAAGWQRGQHTQAEGWPSTRTEFTRDGLDAGLIRKGDWWYLEVTLSETQLDYEADDYDERLEDTDRAYLTDYAAARSAAAATLGAPAFDGSWEDDDAPDDVDAERIAIWPRDPVRFSVSFKHEEDEVPHRLLVAVEPSSTDA
jgi:hypothetical protein